jgi:hypothetical protein
MGKYYNDYGREFFEPRKLGQMSANRMKKEFNLDNLWNLRFPSWLGRGYKAGYCS